MRRSIVPRSLFALMLLVLMGTSCRASAEIIVGFDGQDWVEQSQEFLTYFADEFPDITVKTMSGIGDENIVVMMAGGATPDVYYVRGTWSRGFIEAGFLECLDPFIAASGFSLAKYNQAMMQAYQNEKGETFALPTDLGMVITFINRDQLDDAGLAFPSANWTWDEAARMARRLMKTDSQGVISRYGWTPAPHAAWTWEGMTIAPWGGSLFSDSEDQVLINSPAAIAGLTWWEGVMSTTPLGGDFYSGSSSMLFDGTWRIKNLNQALQKVNWDIAPIPRGPVRRATPTQGSAYGISPHSEKKKEAWTFMSEFLGPRGQKMIWGRGSSPASSEALKAFLEETVRDRNHNAVYAAFESVWLGRPIMPPGEPTFVRVASGPIDEWVSGAISSQELALRLEAALKAAWAN